MLTWPVAARWLSNLSNRKKRLASPPGRISLYNPVMKLFSSKLVIFVSGAALAAIATAALMAPMSLVINGKAVEGKTATVDGATYVPLSALKAAGATADVKGNVLSINLVAGGATQLKGLEGGLNDWLFNGIWRFRATSVTPTDDGRPGWKIHVELRNGTKLDNFALGGSGFDSLSLIMADGNALSVQNIVDISVPGIGQGASISVDLIFYDDEGNGRKPDRLIMRIQPDDATKSFLKNQGASYAVADPSFRINLKPKS